MESIVDVLIAAATACGEFDASRGIKRTIPDEHGGPGAYPLFVVRKDGGDFSRLTTDSYIHLIKDRIECSILLRTKDAREADASANPYGELQRVRRAFLASLWAQSGPPVGASFEIIRAENYESPVAFDGTDCVVCDFVVTCDTDLDLT